MHPVCIKGDTEDRRKKGKGKRKIESKSAQVFEIPSAKAASIIGSLRGD
jgi:hypothetical protein